TTPLFPISGNAGWAFLGIIVPIVIPLLFDFFYDKINQNWTVVTFGCGCPDLDDNYRAFNANHFNLLIWLGVYFVCGSTTIYSASRIDGSQFGRLILVIGIAISAGICWTKFSEGFWL